MIVLDIICFGLGVALYHLIRYIVTKLKDKPVVKIANLKSNANIAIRLRISHLNGKTIVSINDNYKVFHKNKEAEKYLLDHGINVKLGD